MGLWRFRPAEELDLEIPIGRMQILTLFLSKCHGDALHKLNRKAAGKGCSREREAKYCLHLNMVREEQAVSWTARGQFKGTPWNSSWIVRITTNLRREAAQIPCKNNVIWNHTSRHLQRETNFFFLNKKWKEAQTNPLCLVLVLQILSLHLVLKL